MDKIQELTSKLYTEGVEKGKEEAEKIVAEAHAREQEIVAKAQAKADEIIAAANKENTELKKNTMAELKLYARQSVEALKSEIINLITGKITEATVSSAVNNKEFMRRLIVELAKNWAKEEKLTVGVEHPAELEAYIAGNAKEILERGLTVQSVNGIKTGFTLAPEDGSYKVRFGEEEFASYFREFLRPQIQKLLF